MIASRNDGLSKGEADGTSISRDRQTVAVIVTTLNHGLFLAEAVASVLAQTRPADKIVVADDGSSDDLASAIAHFPGVLFIR